MAERAQLPGFSAAVRGGAHTPHRVRPCFGTVNGRPSRQLLVRCCREGPEGPCSSLARGPGGEYLSEPVAAASHLEPLCSLHGGGRRCAGCLGYAHDGWCRRQERLTGIAVDSSARQLCTRCAEASGAKASRRPNVSMEAAGFFAMLAEVGGATVEHERWDVDARCWVGREVEGLVAPWHDRPDGVERNASGRVRRCWFYHGSSVHGYPPHHPLHTSTLSRTGELASVAWARTLASMQRFVAFGYEVRYVCSYEYDAFWRVRESRRRPREELLSIVHML